MMTLDAHVHVLQKLCAWYGGQRFFSLPRVSDFERGGGWGLVRTRHGILSVKQDHGFSFCFRRSNVNDVNAINTTPCLDSSCGCLAQAAGSSGR